MHYRSLACGCVVVSDRAETYAERAGSDQPFVIVGSMGTLEISIANGDASEALGASVRDPVTVSR